MHLQQRLRLVFQRFGLSNLQVRLPKPCSFRGIRSNLQRSFFEEVAPACLPVFRALATFKLLHHRLRVLPATDHIHDSTGFVSPDIVADDSVGNLSFVEVCQRLSIRCDATQLRYKSGGS